jgi:hypothetical protein
MVDVTASHLLASLFRCCNERRDVACVALIFTRCEGSETRRAICAGCDGGPKASARFAGPTSESPYNSNYVNWRVPIYAKLVNERHTTPAIQAEVIQCLVDAAARLHAALPPECRHMPVGAALRAKAPVHGEDDGGNRLSSPERRVATAPSAHS